MLDQAAMEKAILTFARAEGGMRNSIEAVLALPEVQRCMLLAIDPETRHVIQMDDEGWSLKHPLTCRPNLFACPVNAAAQREVDSGGIGVFYCSAEDGQLVIGDAL